MSCDLTGRFKSGARLRVCLIRGLSGDLARAPVTVPMRERSSGGAYGTAAESPLRCPAAFPLAVRLAGSRAAAQMPRRLRTVGPAEDNGKDDRP